MRSRKLSQWHDINSERPDERAQQTHLSHLYLAHQEPEPEPEASEFASPWSTSGWSNEIKKISIANPPRYVAGSPGRSVYGGLDTTIQPRALFANGAGSNIRLVTGMLLVLSAFLTLVIITLLLM